jgi:hypothetical protein
MRFVCWSSVRGIIGATDRSCLTGNPSFQASPLRTFTARHRSCALGMLFPGVPLPIRALTTWPGVGPSLCSPGNAHGVHHRPSQVCSRNGWMIISDHPGPRACLSQPLAPIDFRRVLRFVRSRSMLLAVGLASGLSFQSGVPIWNSRLRSVSRSDCEIRREIVPALGFASCRVCGHIEVHSDGLDPARIIKPQGPQRISFQLTATIAPRIRSWVFDRCSRGQQPFPSACLRA